jgi:SAM-dependent methyltransferase
MSNEAQAHAVAHKLLGKGGPAYFRILDVGCGLAPLLPHLRELIGGRPFAYRGIDTSEVAIGEARRLHGEAGDVMFRVQDATTLHDEEELEWCNIAIVQDVVDELADVTGICQLVAKALVNDGVLYLRARLDAEHTRERFEQRVVRLLERECTFNLHVYETTDASGRQSINLFGYKRSFQHFAKYHYAFGYDLAFVSLPELLALYLDKVVHFGDATRTSRQEGFLRAMSEEHFGTVMNALHDAVAKIRPGKYPLYLKDKLNIQNRGARFNMHQDATARWNDFIGPFEYITFGIPLQAVPGICYGGTRIVIRQDYDACVVPCSDTSVVDPEVYGASIGKKIQYINCVATRGTYYAYDQYILHGSSPNLQDRDRSVIFVTCILTDYNNIYSRAFARRFEELLETRPGKDIIRYRS